jgi:hypothetical protein
LNYYWGSQPAFGAALRRSSHQMKCSAPKTTVSARIIILHCF